jgi:hypothetical protein
MIVSGSGPGVKVMHGGAGSGRHPGPVDVRGAKAAPVPEKGKTSPSPLSNQPSIIGADEMSEWRADGKVQTELSPGTDSSTLCAGNARYDGRDTKIVDCKMVLFPAALTFQSEGREDGTR